MKHAANLSVDADLRNAAKTLSIDLSQTLEVSLRAAVRAKRTELWLAENRAALESYNAWVAKNGLPLDRFRSF